MFLPCRPHRLRILRRVQADVGVMQLQDRIQRILRFGYCAEIARRGNVELTLSLEKFDSLLRD